MSVRLHHASWCDLPATHDGHCGGNVEPVAQMTEAELIEAHGGLWPPTEPADGVPYKVHDDVRTLQAQVAQLQLQTQQVAGQLSVIRELVELLVAQAEVEP